MKKNMGSLDKAIRLALAIAIGILYFLKIISGTLAILLILLATIFVVTSFLSFCPLYPIWGINTTEKEKK